MHLSTQEPNDSKPEHYKQTKTPEAAEKYCCLRFVFLYLKFIFPMIFELHSIGDKVAKRLINKNFKANIFFKIAYKWV